MTGFGLLHAYLSIVASALAIGAVAVGGSHGRNLAILAVLNGLAALALGLRRRRVARSRTEPPPGPNGRL